MDRSEETYETFVGYPVGNGCEGRNISVWVS